MNKEFRRMQKLAGILTEATKPVYVPGSNPDIDDESATMALDMMTKEGTTNKMKVSEFKKKVKEAILAERALKEDANLSVDNLDDEAYADMDNMDEAKKKKKKAKAPEEGDVDIDLGTDGANIDLNLDGGEREGEDTTRVDMNMDTADDVDAGSSESKKAFSELTDAYRAAKALGDEKLIRQIANTITYFNKNIILSQG